MSLVTVIVSIYFNHPRWYFIFNFWMFIFVKHIKNALQHTNANPQAIPSVMIEQQQQQHVTHISNWNHCRLNILVSIYKFRIHYRAHFFAMSIWKRFHFFFPKCNSHKFYFPMMNVAYALSGAAFNAIFNCTANDFSWFSTCLAMYSLIYMYILTRSDVHWIK